MGVKNSQDDRPAFAIKRHYKNSHRCVIDIIITDPAIEQLFRGPLDPLLAVSDRDGASNRRNGCQVDEAHREGLTRHRPHRSDL